MNEKIWKNLETAFNKGKLSHAYIFCGPDGTGKFNMLKKFFELVNKDEFNLAKQEVIVIESEIEEKKGKIRKRDVSAQQAREAIKRASYFVDKGKKKFLVIKDADKLTQTASNVLLKVIEEPKKDTVVALICQREENLLVTIRSRCQRVFFNLLSVEEVEAGLRRELPNVDEDKIKEVAIYCRGKYGLAQELIQNQGLLNEKKEAFDIFRKAIKSDWAEALEAVDGLSKNKEKLLEILDEWIWSLREFLKENIKTSSERKIQRRTLKMVKDLLKVKEKLQNSNANEKIQLENFFIKAI